jgi:hypothetical protein
MIIVPPILSARSIEADHMDINPSEMDLVPMTANDIKARIPVKDRIEYLPINKYK